MNINYKQEGSGFPLIILHGFLGMLDNWQALSKIWSSNFTVYTLDARNHGRSFWNNTHNYEVMSEDVREFMNELNIDSCYLLGHSMGGKTAMHFASLYPELVKKLIVVDIAPKYYPVHHGEIFDGIRAVPLPSIQKRQEAEVAMMPFISEQSTRQFILKSLYRKSEGGFAWRFNVDVLWNQIEEIGKNSVEHSCRIPTLFLAGGKSKYIEFPDIHLIHDLFPVSRIETIQDSGHWLHAENPKEFSRLVLSELLP